MIIKNVTISKLAFTSMTLILYFWSSALVFYERTISTHIIFNFWINVAHVLQNLLINIG